jgi:hypothetical protein
VPLVETQRFALLDRRPGVSRSIRRAVRVALPVAAVSALMWLLPASEVAHLVLLLDCSARQATRRSRRRSSASCAGAHPGA